MVIRFVLLATSLILVFLGPYFFYQSMLFLRRLDYMAALLGLLAGWFLLRAGIDLTRIALAANRPATTGPPGTDTKNS